MKTIAEKAWEKKDKLHARLEMYQAMNNGMFNIRDYSKHIDRARKSIWKVNEILYKEENINRKLVAL